MANTIAEAGAAGWRAAESMRQAPIQTKLLSQKAEDNQRILDNAKEEKATKLAANARLLEAKQGNANIDGSTIKGQLDLLQIAKSNTKNPEALAKLRKDETTLLGQAAENTQNRTILASAKKSRDWDLVNSAFDNPEEGIRQLRKRGTDENDTRFLGLSMVLGNYRKVPGTNKLFNQLSAEEKSAFKQRLATATAPESSKAAINMQKEALNRAKLDVQKNRYAQLEQASTQKIAILREKLATATGPESKKTGQLIRLDSAYNRQLNKINNDLYGNGTPTRPGLEAEIENEDYNVWARTSDTNPKTIPNPAYVAKEKELVELDIKYERDLARIEGRAPKTITKDPKTLPTTFNGHNRPSGWTDDKWIAYMKANS